MDKFVDFPQVRTGVNYDRDAASDATGLICPEASLAQQQFAEESDINTIVKRFNLTGQLPSDFSIPQYGDFLDVPGDYRQALSFVAAAEAAFMELPAGVRARLGNDPQVLLDLVSKAGSDPSAAGLVRELGLSNIIPADSRGGPEGGGAAPGDGGGAPMQTGLDLAGQAA